MAERAEVPGGRWTAFTAAEREDFFSAVVRHNRAAWRVTAACAAAYAMLGLVMSLLMAPLLYSVIGLGFDLANLVTPTPDLFGQLGRKVSAFADALDNPRWYASLSTATILRTTVITALPGLAVFAIAVRIVRHALKQSPLFHPGIIIGRAADPTTLREVQLTNTVQEMAIAAGIPLPRVVFVDGGANAAGFGVDRAHATVLVSAELVSILTREQMQGIAGHVVGSIANGDMTIGLRTAITLGVFSMAAALSTGWTTREEFAATWRVIRALLAPTPANIDLILARLANPFADATRGDDELALESLDPHQLALARAAAIDSLLGRRSSAIDRLTAEAARHRRPKPVPASSTTLSWREWLLMPLMGPVFLSGFLGGLVNTMLLEPLVSLAWRERKYMADATSVQLTRDPDALDGALLAIANAGASARIAPWAGHLCVVDPGTKRDAGLLGGSWLSMFPSLRRRHEALVRMGASNRASGMWGRQRIPPWLGAIFATLGLVIVGLLGVVIVMLLWVSTALSGLFTVAPAALLHVILRAVSRH
jgi:Zn-dependent protease with chaperone function